MEFLKEFLDEKHDKYNRPEFIKDDPISVPHSFSIKEDIEISGFLSASIAWGKRSIIVQNARKITDLMGNKPYDFVMNATENQIEKLLGFKHRTFNALDLVFFIKSLRNIYKNHAGLEMVFAKGFENEQNIKSAIAYFREVFFSIEYPLRTQKHISNVNKNSAAKRINMFLRWMVRNDNRGVDFGLWNLPVSELMLPLDLHTGNCGRKLELLLRTQNDWQAVEELTLNLKKFDPFDPVKYDFALFGLGIDEKFCSF